jgi:hypothetical protein
VASLDRKPPDFGFPAPPDQHHPVRSTGADDIGRDISSIVPAGDEDDSPASPTAPTETGYRKDQNAVVPGQRDLSLPSVVPASKSEPTGLSEVPTAKDDAENTPEKSVAVRKACDDREKPRVLGSADLIAQYRVDGSVRLADTNKPFLTWMTLLYLGGMHYKAISSYLDRTPSSVQATMYRMQLPRDRNRGSFGWTCDLECAVAQLKQWNFELFRCTANPDLAEEKRPWFWRRKGDTGNRRRRCSRLKNKELAEYSKYKDGQSVEIMTRERFEAQCGISKADAGVRHPARLHASVQGSLAFQQGAANEQFALRGHAPAVRSGFSGNARDPMPWAYPRNGSAARPVAHP